MKFCKYCNTVLFHHAAKVCDACFPSHIKNYSKKYRQENKAACRERIKRSQEKNKEKYVNKRRENYRKKRGIPLDDPFRKRKNGDGTIDSQGYKTISKRGHPNQMDLKGRIREHVYIMSEYLGRPLTKSESVHHKNGVRTDNRIENLELWHRGQPSGARLEDKIEWAKSFLQEYGYLVLKDV